MNDLKAMVIRICVMIGCFARRVCRAEQSPFLVQKELSRIAISLQIVQAW